MMMPYAVAMVTGVQGGAMRLHGAVGFTYETKPRDVVYFISIPKNILRVQGMTQLYHTIPYHTIQVLT